MAEKVQLVQAHQAEYGLNACCAALQLSKGTWHYRQHHSQGEPSDPTLKAAVSNIIAEHPGYGYRPMIVELKAEYGLTVNHKKLRRLLHRWQWALKRSVSKPPHRAIQKILDEGAGHLNLVKDWEPGPLEMLSTDFTELGWANGTRKAWLIAMVDPVGRGAMGWAVGLSANRSLARQCWDQIIERFTRWKVPLEHTVIHQDMDPVFTSNDWLYWLLLEAGCLVSFSERGAKDNPWIESFWGRFKDENASKIITAQTASELEQVIDEGFRYYNEDRRHSGLDYLQPIEYYKQEGILPDGLTTF